MPSLAPVMIVLQDVNNDEIELGPFCQTCTEIELFDDLGSICTIVKDVVTREPIVISAGGFWWHEGHPYKQLFTRSTAEATT